MSESFDSPPIVSAPEPPPEPIPEEQWIPLERLPTPPYLLVLCAITLFAFILGILRFPGALAVGVDYEKGQRELAAGQNQQAAKHFAKVQKAYPKSVDVRLDLADAYIRSGQYGETAEVMESFGDDEKVTDEQQARFSQIESQLAAKAKELGYTGEEGGN